MVFFFFHFPLPLLQSSSFYDAEKVKGLTRFSLYFCINVGSFFINSSGFLNMYTTQYHQFDVFVHQPGQEDHIHRKNRQKVKEKTVFMA